MHWIMKIYTKILLMLWPKPKLRDVKHLLAIGVTLSRFEKAYPELATFPNVSLACGVHPLDLEEEPYDADRLLRLSQDKK